MLYLYLELKGFFLLTMEFNHCKGTYFEVAIFMKLRKNVSLLCCILSWSEGFMLKYEYFIVHIYLLKF